MGRRALRKIDPHLCLDQYLREIEELEDSFDCQTIFGRTAPLEIEVGTGKGMFLAGAAEAHPQHNYLGIEVSRKYARFAAARLAKYELTNARMICGDALRLFDHWFPDGCATAVHVYFPDPWWKKRHKKRRVMNSSFLTNVQRVLQAGGSLYFWTDVEEYFQTANQLIAEVTRLEGPFDVAVKPADHTLDYRTHFERRMRMENLPVYRAEFRKPQ